MSKNIIRKLVDRRNELGLSQAEVAARMGTSQSAVARFETRIAEPRASTLLRYAGAVGISLDLTELASELSSQPAPGTQAVTLPRVRPDLDLGVSGEPNPNYVLSWRQRNILAFMKGYVDINGYAPTLREICAGVGLTSLSSVHYQIKLLVKNGYLRRIPGQPRAMGFVPSGASSDLSAKAADSVVFAPLVAHLPDGSLTEQDVEDVLPLPGQVVGDGDLLVIRFSGHDMGPARILDGDLVAVRTDAEVQEGDLVVARVNGELTVRILRCAGDFLWLMSYNRDESPAQAERTDMVGPVVAVMRSL